jgi:hypothetical protein
MIKKFIDSFARYGGLVTVCAEWLAFGLFYILRPAAFDGQSPISYFASYPETRLAFTVCLTIAAVSFWIFTTWHLPKYYNTPVRLFAVSMLGYALLALIPFDPANFVSDTIHRLLALFFALTYLIGIYLVGRRNTDTQVRRVSYLTSGLSLLVMIMFFATPKGSELILILEALSAALGQAWVVWISFHSFRKSNQLTP